MIHTHVHFLPLCWSFFKIGASAFGGGIAALPVFEAELVNRRHWLTPHEVAEAYAICQSIPGVIIINFAVFTGLRLTGKRGAILAAIAVAIPSFLIILAMATVIEGHWQNRWISAALSGLRPAVIAIVVGAAIRPEIGEQRGAVDGHAQRAIDVGVDHGKRCAVRQTDVGADVGRFVGDGVG